MNTRNKNILVFCAALLLAIGVYVWFYPFNKGVLMVTGNTQGYFIFAGEKSVECPDNTCAVPLAAGFYTISIQKDGYFQENIRAEIRRGKTNNVSIGFKKIPSLKVSAYTPQEETSHRKAVPAVLDGSSVLAPVWDVADSNFAFIDSRDDRLKIFSEDGNVKQLVSFKNISDRFNLIWSPDGRYLFGAEDDDIYFINITKFSRKKMTIGFSPKNIVWSSESEYLLMNDRENDVYKADFINESVEPFSFALDLSASVWDKNGDIIYFSYEEKENKTIAGRYGVSAKEHDIILTKYNFRAGDIAVSESGEIYLYDLVSGSWHELDY